MKWLYRAALLALLIRFDSTLSDILRRLSVLHELAAHPPYKHFTMDVPEFNIPGWKPLSERYPEHFQGSKSGDRVQPPSTSSPVSPGATIEQSAKPASTEEPGRWTPTSGRLGVDWGSPDDPNSPPTVIKTSWPTAAGLPVAGSPGPVDPEFTDKAEIIASGYQAICTPSLRYPMHGCNQHPHVKGERLEAHTDSGDD